MNDKRETQKITALSEIVRTTLSEYEVRGVFRIIDNTPAGPKSSYQEKKIDEMPLEYLYGGVLLVCPSGDRTDGRMKLEISVRDCTMRVDRSASSADAAKLQQRFIARGYDFKIMT